MYNFRVYQFAVESDLSLPCDTRCQALAAGHEGNNLVIRYAPHSLYEFSQVHWVERLYDGLLRAYDVGSGVLVCAADQSLRDVVKLHIDRSGSTLTVDTPSRYLQEAAYYAVGMGIPICLLFRGSLPLHAAGATVDGNLIGIMGASGAGKSTLLYTLLEEGGQFATDDVLPVHIIDGCAMATPAVSLHLKLRKGTLENYGLDWTQYEEVRQGAPEEIEPAEFWIPISPESRLQEVRPLAALFVLQPRPALLEQRSPRSPEQAVDQVLVRRKIGAGAISLLLANTHALWAGYEQLDKKKCLSQYAALVQHLPIYTIEYPKRFEMSRQLVRIIRELLHHGPLCSDSGNDTFESNSVVLGA